MPETLLPETLLPETLLPETLLPETLWAFAVPATAEGQRLDRFLSDAPVHEQPSTWPHMGLRGWRRACENACVLVNGRLAAPGLRLREGQRIEVLTGAEAGVSGHPPGHPQESQGVRADALPSPRFLAHTALFAAVEKPAGWHSAHLAGGTGQSIAAWLAAEPRIPAPEGLAPFFSPHLLNRLDQLTSGLLVLALRPESQARWSAWEAAGRISKHYLTVVEGFFEEPFVARQALDTQDRRTSRVLKTQAEPLRQTRVAPLLRLGPDAVRALFPSLAADTPMTLAACHIHCGARHQIRAHLAGAGHPLVGDRLYGSVHDAVPLLHHRHLTMPDWEVSCPPPWQGRCALWEP